MHVNIKKCAKFKLIILVIFIFNSGFTGVSFASEFDSLRTVYTLDEVTVYASSAAKALSMVSVIDEERIISQPGASISGVFTIDPGVSVAAGRKNSSDLSIRGANTQSMLFLIDGRPVNTGYFGGIDLSLIPPNQVEKIQIIKGPAGVAYGANSLGGIVNVITRGGLRTEPQITVNSRFGSDNYREYRVSAGADIGRYTGWLTYENTAWEATRLSEDFKSTDLEDGGKRENSDLNRQSVNFKLGRDLGSLGYASVSYGMIEAQKGLPGSIYKPEYWEFTDWSRHGGNLSLLLKPHSQFDLKLSLYRNNYSDELINYLDDSFSIDRIDYDSQMRSLTWGNSAELSWYGIGRNVLTAGVKFSEDHSRRRDLQPETEWTNSTSHLTSIYLDDAYDMGNGYSLRAGIGSYSYSLLRSESEMNSTGYMGGISKEISPELTVAYATSRSVFFPTQHNLFSPGRGNPDLEPEHAWKHELKISSDADNHDGKHISFETSIFYNRTRNQIDLHPDTRLFVNIKSLNTWGMETSLSTRIGRYYSVETMLGVMDWDAGSDELYNTPHMKLGIRGSFRDLLKSRGYIEATMFREREASVGRGATGTMPAYLLLNAGYTYQVLSNLSLSIDAKNLLDEDYEEIYGYPAPGRQIFGGLALRFSR